MIKESVNAICNIIPYYKPELEPVADCKRYFVNDLPDGDPEKARIQKRIDAMKPYVKDVYTTAPQHRKKLERSDKW